MKPKFLALIGNAHRCSGLSLRELAAIYYLDPSFVSLIVSGERRPSRDALIILCAFGWQISREVTDEILIEGNYPALSRSIRRKTLEIEQDR